ncbi:MAG: UDP-N-acetylmuramoyl-L-alanyl-D-glutamate--2,6-diaminopimelate ligase [Phycisphaeraceae bacterium]|nr:MAG: UDP-N-acetylmuramoyl-L-alanyl-D-glutamate--2,6-diaminopimelate ligase [Phycisphaeraceae bacterium]
MTLGDLISGFGLRLRDPGAAGVRICDITEDSRTVMPGSLFIARRGERHDGRVHIAGAVRAGAAAVLVDAGDGDVKPAGVPIVEADDIMLAMAQLGERFYGDPSSSMALIGVTGTNGKTTVAHLAHQLMGRAGKRCGLIGTVTIDDGVDLVPASMTTPGAIELSRLLSVMLESGCEAVAMEVSSHALEQKRVAALRFKVGVFTNLTGDHLDYHGSMEAYARAKRRLFELLPDDGLAIINSADPHARDMVAKCPARILKCAIGQAPDAEGCAISGVPAGPMRTHVKLVGPWGEIEGDVALVGEHNLMNLLQAVAAVHGAGAPRERIEAALRWISAPPGRCEPVIARDDSGAPIEAHFTTLVDFAHTDDALRSALTALRPALPTGGKLRVVFGCGGDRDTSKRPRMGAVASELADHVIITSDNPRTEDPEAIISEILAGAPASTHSRIDTEADRERAIRLAVSAAREGDIVLIAGKGHEKEQILPDGHGGTAPRPFDDLLIAAEAIRRRFAGITEQSAPPAIVSTPTEHAERSAGAHSREERG